MHSETKIMIRKRAEAIGRLAAHQLEYDDDTEAAEAFKYAYLALRGPKAYLAQFHTDLHINTRQVETFLWRNQERLFGGLLPEEVEIVDVHNREVDRFGELRPMPTMRPLPSSPTATVYRLEQRSGQLQ